MYLATDVDDLRAVRECLAGDPNAFQPIVERYHPVLFNVAFRILGNREEAADVTQDTFVKVYQALPRFDQNRRFYSWMYRIMVNECLNAKRAQRPVEPLGAHLVAPGSAAAALESAERRRRVHEAILGLSPEYRTVIALRHFAGLSYEDMGAALDLPVKTVRSRLHTARQRLAAHLQEDRVRV